MLASLALVGLNVIVIGVLVFEFRNRRGMKRRRVPTLRISTLDLFELPEAMRPDKKDEDSRS